MVNVCTMFEFGTELPAAGETDVSHPHPTPVRLAHIDSVDVFSRRVKRVSAKAALSVARPACRERIAEHALGQLAAWGKAPFGFLR